MDQELLISAKKAGEKRGISVEVKSLGNSYYFYIDTTRWDKDKEEDQSIGIHRRITEHGPIENNSRIR